MPHTYRQLDVPRIVETTRQLRDRVRERFATRGLTAVAEELVEVSEGAADAVTAIQRPILSLRAGIVVLLMSIALLAGTALTTVPLKATKLSEGNYSEVITTVEATIASIVFLGAALAFLVGMENRVKRSRCLRLLHELRALAHVVDMHQLTKDPDRLLRRGEDTASSPKTDLSPFLLGRYLDYCSEMQSLISKVAALYAQASVDPNVVRAVDEIETLTNGLSRKMWQKLVMLEQIAPQLAAGGTPPAPAAAQGDVSST